MSSETAPMRPARVLFLTPFNFADPANDDAFDAAVAGQLGGADIQVIATHVPRFDADDASYEAEQEKAVLGALGSLADPVSAVVIACHYDPAVAAARQASSVPVVAPLQVTSGLAMQFGPRFAVITDVDEAVPVITGLLHSYGHGDALTSVHAIGLDGDTILADTKAAAEIVDRLVAQIAEERVAQSVVIGCTIASSAYERHRHEFPDHGLVVVNSNDVTVRVAAALGETA